MTVGLSSFVLDSPLTPATLERFPGVRAMGYGLIEVAYQDRAEVGAAEIRAAAERSGLRLSVAGDFTGGRDLSAEDPELRLQGCRYLIECVEFATQLGADVVAGPMYSAVGKRRLLPPAERRQQWDRAVESIRSVAEVAADRGVRLAIEPLNRFETDLVNTTQQGIALCEEIDRENVGLSLDTFHMNIEDDSLGDAIAAAAPHLISFQASENTRGTPGSGHVPWPEVFTALREAEYSGPVIVEAFATGDEGLVEALSLWREVAPSMDRLMRDSIAFINALWRT